MRDKPLNVLFLCTGNSARSIMAEALLQYWGSGRFKAFSAGSHPRGKVHPMAQTILREYGHDISHLRSKSWDEFTAGAPEMDIIITVCDNAAGETCPVWPGRPIMVHWGVEDPDKTYRDENEARNSFLKAYCKLEHSIRILTALPPEKLDMENLQAQLVKIGVETESAD